MMKKILLPLTMIIFMLVISGCYGRNRSLELEQINVYDINGIEVEGVYKDYYREITNNFSKINSPAPVINYYTIETTEGASYDVVFTFKASRKTKIKAVLLEQVTTHEKYEITDITYDGKMVKATYHIDGVNESQKLIRVASYLDTDGKKYAFGERGGHTYIRGVYFIFDKSQKDTKYTVI